MVAPHLSWGWISAEPSSGGVAARADGSFSMSRSCTLDGTLSCLIWAGGRRSVFPVSEGEEAYFTTQPDCVCEVLSKSTARYDRTDKLTIYAGEKIPFVWLVDPVIRTLEVLVLEGERWVMHGTFKDDDIVKAPPFEAVGLELGALWMPES